MGSTSTHREPGMTTLEFFQRELPTMFEQHEVVAWNSDKDGFYAAMRVTSEEAYYPLDVTWALVIATWRNPRDYFNYAYKVMDEQMGPGVDGASRKVLDALTGTDHQYALDWRGRVRARLDKKHAKVGDTIKLTRPLKFGDGVERDTFTIETREQWTRRGTRKQTVLRGTDGVVVKIPGWKEYDYSIVTAEVEAAPEAKGAA